MHLLETYSHFAGVPLKEAFIDEAFYPVPFDKYILVQNSSGMRSKNFDNWDLITTNIKMPIIQIGAKEDQILPNVFDLRGHTTWNQSAYILRRAALFLGNDSVMNHMASAFNVPRIVLFGATSPKTCGGYFNKNSAVEITPFDMMGCKAPCHAAECARPQKCINSIPVKYILENVANIVGKDFVNVCEIVHVGALSRHPVLEWIPYDISPATVNILSKVAGIITVRHDLSPINLNLISNVLNPLNLKYIIVGSAPDIANVSILPQKVEQVLIKINQENIKESLAVASSLQSKYYRPMFVSELNHEVFNDYKLQMLNYPPIAKLSDFEPDDKQKLFIGQKLQVQSHRNLIGRNGRFFATKHDAINNKNLLENPQENIYINIEAEHLKELQYLIFKKYE